MVEDFSFMMTIHYLILSVKLNTIKCTYLDSLRDLVILLTLRILMCMFNG